MSESFDAAYIKRHRQNIHNYDSFGRAVVDAILREAEKKASPATASSKKIDFPVEVSVTPVPSAAPSTGGVKALFCVDVTVVIAGIPATIHVGVG